MICPTCGVDAMTEGGACTYCTGGHLTRVTGEAVPDASGPAPSGADAPHVDETKPKGKGKK